MELLGYNLKQVAKDYWLSFCVRAGSRNIEAAWTKELHTAIRTEYRTIAGDLYLCGHKVGDRLETCYLTAGEASNGGRQAIWLPCPVTPIAFDRELQPLDGYQPPFITFIDEQGPLYLSRDHKQAMFLPRDASSDGQTRIKTGRHELLMTVNLKQGTANWRYRHHYGDTWRAGSPLEADLHNELCFFLELDADLPPEKIRRVRLQCTPEEGSPKVPWSGHDLVAAGSTYRDSVFVAECGTVRKPGGGPWNKDSSYLYAWGDVIALNTEGSWEVEASVEIEGHGRFDTDPRMCVGGGCDGNEPSDC